jgi:hypothetical protein
MELWAVEPTAHPHIEEWVRNVGAVTWKGKLAVSSVKFITTDPA